MMNDGKINWNEAWKNQMQKNIGSNRTNDYASLWGKKLNAKIFCDITLTNDGDRIEKTVNSLPIKSTSHVLDIGSGPGTLSLEISKKVEHVTAVEPSTEMMNVM